MILRWLFRSRNTDAIENLDLTRGPDHYPVTNGPHPDTGYVMTPDEQRIYDWITDRTHPDTKSTILPPGALVELRNNIAAGRHRNRGLCVHCNKPIDIGKAASWGTAKWKVHEGCRSALFSGRDKLGQPGSGDEKRKDYLVDQNAGRDFMVNYEVDNG